MKLYFLLSARAFLVVVLLVSTNAYAGFFHIDFSGVVSDVTSSNDLVSQGDRIAGTLTIDAAAPNWYGDDQNWGAYEANVELTYGKVAVNSMIALYIDVRGNELFGVARVPIDLAGMIYSDFRFWVELQDVGSTSLAKAFNAMASSGAAALLTFDRSQEIQSYARDVKITLLPVPEAPASASVLGGLAVLLAMRQARRRLRV